MPLAYDHALPAAGDQAGGLRARSARRRQRDAPDHRHPAASRRGDRLLVCEVLTPAGNWSSYPPHKHDRHAPPVEADLEETYYYRFSGPDGYGIQRLYTADGRTDETLQVTDRDLVLVRDGYHPFVAAPGFDAYYLNTLAGSFRSMAATDDPRYAHLRASWPPPDARVPMIPRPCALVQSFLSVAIGSMRAARRAGTDTASAHDVTMTSRLAAYATGSKTSTTSADLRGGGCRHQDDRHRRGQAAAGRETDADRAERL